MSRHLLIDRPDFQLVVGFDHMLQSFFGQVFNPARDPGIAIDGWPTSSGLGTRRFVESYAQAVEDVDLLLSWALVRKRPLDDGAPEDRSTHWADYFLQVRRVLLREWNDGQDGETPPVPAFLREPRASMSRTRDLDPRVAVAAGVIANARHGAPRVTNILDVLPDKLFAEVVDDAHAAIVAVDLHDLTVAARSGSRLSAGYMDALRLDLGASTLLVLMRDRGACASAAFSAAGAGTMALGHEAATDLWRAVTGFVRAAASEPPPTPAEQEPTP